MRVDGIVDRLGGPIEPIAIGAMAIPMPFAGSRRLSRMGTGSEWGGAFANSLHRAADQAGPHP